MLAPLNRHLKALLAAALLLTALPALALPPAAPTNVRAAITKFIHPSDSAKNFDYYLVQWDDNALDESGYQVRVRLGTRGGFVNIDSVPANSTQTLLTLTAFPAGTVLQFQVVAYKMNGTKVESKVGTPTASVSVPADTTFNAPSGLTAVSKVTDSTLNDGSVHLQWTDLSTQELYYEIQMKKTSAASFTSLGTVLMNNNDLTLNLGLTPGTSYDFQVRALQPTITANTYNFSGFSNVATVVTAPLAAPSGLAGQVIDEDSYRLTWADNSSNEMGYAMEYSYDNTTFNTLTYANAGATSYVVSVPAGATVYWRVKAAFEDSATSVISTSAPSNVVTFFSTFNPPTTLAGVANGVSGGVTFTWADHSDAEDGYEIFYRTAGSTGSYTSLLTVPTNITTATYTGLPTGAALEFIVAAFQGSSSPSYSADSNSVTLTPLEGFDDEEFKTNSLGTLTDPPLLTPLLNVDDILTTTEIERVIPNLVQGTAFSFPIATTDSGNRTAWTVTGLPGGVTFDDGTGVISGTPTTAGVFNCPMTATFADAHTATATLVLRVQKPAANPVPAAALASKTIGTGSPFSFSLNGAFTDPDSERAVRVQTSEGNVDILLYESLVPQGVANFLAYVNGDDYNGTAFHRALSGFILQGGGFKPTTAPNIFTSTQRRVSPLNEPGISNLRGTVASAKVGNDPNSATHDFFFNQEDSNATNLDNQNAGFTVFGRVAGAGMSVVDSIIALPQRTYTDVIVDGSTGTFANWPMKADSAPTAMDITKTVKITDASEIPVLTYSISNNTTPTVATASVSGSNVQLTGLTDGTTDVTVQAADLDGNTTSQTFTVTVQGGFIAPSITTQPASQSVVAGTATTLSVVAVGTDLTYQWRQDGSPIIGEVGPSLQIADFQPANAGNYDVVITNAAASITSAVATLSIKTTPSVTPPTPASVFIAAGQPLNLTSTVTGAPAPAITWTRNNRLILGQTSATLNIPSVALTDAGAYRLKAKNTTTVTSAPANVNIVDAAGARIVVAPTKTATMRVLIKGTGPFSYEWRKGSTTLTNGGTISGVTTGTLTIRNCDFSSTGLYACRVTGPDGLTVIDCGPYDLRVVTAPGLSNFTAPTAFVGAGYSYTVPYSSATGSTPTSFVITGLPPGMTYNRATGQITGRPTRAGSFTFKVRASNPAGSSALVTATMFVVPLDSYTIGSYVGLFARQTELNRDTGGRADLSVSDTGAYSGKVNLAGVSYSIKGTVDVRSDGSIQGISTITRRNLPTLTFGFVVSTTTGGLSGTITDGTHTSELLGWRQFWSSTFLPCYFAANNTTAETYSIAMNIPAGSIGNAAIPQGTGFASIKVSTSGIATISGKTIDGNTITCSGIVGPSGQVAVFQPLYKNTGGLLGPLQLVTATNGYTKVTTLTATGFDHAKQAGPSTERTYQAGFAPVALAVVGGPYRAPGKNVRIMNLTTGAAAAELIFSAGGLGNATIINQPNITFDLSAANVALLPKAGTVGNPAKVSLSINTSSGLISGGFTVVAPTPDTGDDPAKTVSRTAKIMGRLVPTGSEASSYTLFGVGQFQLTDLADPTRGPILTGKVKLDPDTP